jgi:hypothetical protein
MGSFGGTNGYLHTVDPRGILLEQKWPKLDTKSIDGRTCVWWDSALHHLKLVLIGVEPIYFAATAGFFSNAPQEVNEIVCENSALFNRSLRVFCRNHRTILYTSRPSIYNWKKATRREFSSLVHFSSNSGSRPPSASFRQENKHFACLYKLYDLFGLIVSFIQWSGELLYH